jgi:hypothetical protein
MTIIYFRVCAVVSVELSRTRWFPDSIGVDGLPQAAGRWW